MRFSLLSSAARGLPAKAAVKMPKTGLRGSIGASGRAKDDRVIAAALAHWVWVQSLKSQLTAQRMTLREGRIKKSLLLFEE